MDKLHLMRVYVAVAEEQGFSAAARRLGMSPPSVTRAVAALEEDLGVKLLDRTTRYVRATEVGIRYLEDARKILFDVDAADETATGINAEPRGHIAVTAPVLFGQKYVIPGIVDYMQRYPGTEVDAVFLDRVVNLLEEGLDIGIRIGQLPDSSMRALRVGSVRLVVCASPGYIKRCGRVQQPDQINRHSVITSSAGSLSKDWRFQTGGSSQIIRVKPRLRVTTNDAALMAAKEGFGITRLMSYQVVDYLESGELEILLEKFELPSLPVHIVHREGRLTSTKVRAFIDLMAERLRSDKRLNSK